MESRASYFTPRRFGFVEVGGVEGEVLVFGFLCCLFVLGLVAQHSAIRSYFSS